MLDLSSSREDVMIIQSSSGPLAVVWLEGAAPPSEVEVIVEVLEAETNAPLHDVPVVIERIVGGSQVAQGETGQDGRTMPLKVPVSSNNANPLGEFRVKAGFPDNERSPPVFFAYAQRWSYIPPELLQPAAEPHVHTVFLELDGPPKDDLVRILPRRSESPPCLGGVEQPEWHGFVPSDRHDGGPNAPVIFFDQYYYLEDEPVFLPPGALIGTPKFSIFEFRLESEIAIIDLEPDALFEVPCITQQQPPKATSWLQGVVHVVHQLVEGTELELGTRNAISGPRGTEFTVDSSQDEVTHVLVFDGAVEVTPLAAPPAAARVLLADSRSVLVHAGERASASDGQVGPIVPIGLLEPTGLGQPPQVTGFVFPDNFPVGEFTEWQVGFADADADVNAVLIEQEVEGSLQLIGFYDPGVGGQAQGAFPVFSLCEQAGQIQGRVSLADGNGNLSDPLDYQFQCGATDVAAIVAQQNGTPDLIDTADILQAVAWWLNGEIVPGTGQLIDTPTMLNLVAMWLSATPVSTQ